MSAAALRETEAGTDDTRDPARRCAHVPSPRGATAESVAPERPVDLIFAPRAPFHRPADVARRFGPKLANMRPEGGKLWRVCSQPNSIAENVNVNVATRSSSSGQEAWPCA